MRERKCKVAMHVMVRKYVEHGGKFRRNVMDFNRFKNYILSIEPYANIKTIISVYNDNIQR